MSDNSIVTETKLPDPNEPREFSPEEEDFITFGQKLEDALWNASAPLVMAVDGPWGCGKSYFLRRWASHIKAIEQQEAQKQLEYPRGIKVIYFDAFKKDYLEDPLVSLLLAVVEHIPDQNGIFKEAAKKVLPVLLKSTFNILTAGATRELGELSSAVAEAANNTVQLGIDELNGWWRNAAAREGGMEELQKALTEAMEAEGRVKKLFVIVDELDRCRPNYALRVLETIKHVFAVPNVHFVLGVNLEQLARSVQHAYGTGISGEKYLQRFVHAKMTMKISNESSPDWRHLRARDYLKGIRNDEKNLNLARVLDWVDINENITYREMQRLDTLAQLTRMPNYGLKGLDASAAMILNICKPEFYASLRDRDNTQVKYIKKFFSIEFGERPINMDEEHIILGAWILLQLNEAIPIYVEDNYLQKINLNSTKFNPGIFDRIDGLVIL